MALESARAIVVEEGISALSGRKVTARMGYSIGTLYQIFDGMDDLVERMNARTLEALYNQCEKLAKHRNWETTTPWTTALDVSSCETPGVSSAPRGNVV